MASLASLVLIACLLQFIDVELEIVVVCVALSVLAAICHVCLVVVVCVVGRWAAVRLI